MSDPYLGRKTAAEEALRPLKSGQHVLLGAGAGAPLRLVEALKERARELSDVEVLHLMQLGPDPFADPVLEGRLRSNALFLGPGERGEVERGLADYTPCSLSQVPDLIRTGRIPVDAALIQTTPPRDGFVSLGASVDILRAAAENAERVVAQVNARMPWTEGLTRVPVESIHAFVESDLPLPEYHSPDLTAAALWIGRYAARLIADGATVQVGLGSVGEGVLAALGRKKDLGVHTELLTDAWLPLIEAGVFSGRLKTLHREKIVATLCLGSRRLYDFVGDNPLFEFHPADYVNCPEVIAKNAGLVAVNSALAVDLTGQAAVDSLDGRFFGGVGGHLDFARGAACARGGRFILALPATARGGKASRVVASLGAGTGVCLPRADADFVVTEYGIASLRGRSLRERAVALISIAHPDFRKSLSRAASAAGLLDAGHVFPADAAPYPAELEGRARLGGREFLVRPLRPADERKLKDLFYSQSLKTTTMRFGVPLKRLSEREFQELVALDLRRSLALGAFTRERGRERLVAVARYCAAPGSKVAESAVTVHDDWQGRGLGAHMTRALCAAAARRGVEGLRAELQHYDPRMKTLLGRLFTKVEELDLGDDGTCVTVLFKDWREGGAAGLSQKSRAEAAL